jgi:hypothetical protein
MTTIQDIQKNSTQANKIRSALMFKELTIRKWALSHNFPYTLTYQVVMGDCGKLQSPFTKSYKIQQALKAEGFWPEDEEIAA